MYVCMCMSVVVVYVIVIVIALTVVNTTHGTRFWAQMAAIQRFHRNRTKSALGFFNFTYYCPCCSHCLLLFIHQYKSRVCPTNQRLS